MQQQSSPTPSSAYLAAKEKLAAMSQEELARHKIELARQRAARERAAILAMRERTGRGRIEAYGIPADYRDGAVRVPEVRRWVDSVLEGGSSQLVIRGTNGTGKTTLSTDPKRQLIGDDEHGWDDDGVFNFEGGCYAKVINLSQENEPDIWNAIRRNALLENVTVDKKGKIDYADKSVTENTRVSYPIFHIENIVKPVSKAPAAKKVIFLSADAFGVLPPVSILNAEQTKYYFLSGFTAKLAGTERGITEPTPTFSACFGAAFLSLHPTKYGEELVKKMKKAGAKAYLVNTGWNGTGKRISIKDTRGIIDAILDGSIDKAPTKTLPIFDFTIPTELPGVDTKILDPRDTYKNAKDWDVKAEDLANRFVKNFVKFTGNEEGKKLVAAGPKVK